MLLHMKNMNHLKKYFGFFIKIHQKKFFQVWKSDLSHEFYIWEDLLQLDTKNVCFFHNVLILLLEVNQCCQLCLFNSDGSNNVRSSMIDRSKPKIGCSSSITNRLSRSSSFDVRKSDVRVSSKSNLVNPVKALLGSKFDVWSFEAKNRVF